MGYIAYWVIGFVGAAIKITPPITITYDSSQSVTAKARSVSLLDHEPLSSVVAG
jgi:hypothetical protein